MKRIVITGCVACAAVVLVLTWYRPSVPQAGHEGAATNGFAVEITSAPAQPMGSSQATGIPVTELAGSSTNSTAARRLTLEDIEPLLQRGRRLRPREVPSLEAEVEAALCQRYKETVEIADKFAILQVLALGGSSKSIPLFAGAIDGEFRGRSVSGEENAMLHHIPIMLGFLAHREPSAIEVLHTMASAVTADRLWHENLSPPEVNTVRLRAFEGLGASGRQEVKAWLESCRALPASSSSDPRAVASAAYNFWLVETYGFDASVADFQNDGEKLVRAVWTWQDTAGGKSWQAWGRNPRSGR